MHGEGKQRIQLADKKRYDRLNDGIARKFSKVNNEKSASTN